MHRTASTDEALDRLSRIQANGHRVLSLYVSLDPSEFPNLRERHAQVDAVLDEAERRAEGGGDGSHEDRLALRAAIEHVRGFLTDAELAVQSARGLAVFYSAPADLFEVVALPRPVTAMAVVQERPFIEPLVALAAPERWCVLLVSRRAGRILYGTREHLLEAASVLDDVRGQHAQGGRSQSRYQRGIESEVDEHVRRTCSALFEHFKARGFERLLLAGPAELRPRVEHDLHPDLSRRLAGHFEIDVERATPDEVHQRAAPQIEADERRRERETLERLTEGMAPGGHAAAGLDEVLQLLNERRVQTLLLAHGFATPGFECPRCGRLASSDGPCPADGAALEPWEDITERAIHLALDQSAAVIVVRHEADALRAHAPIAALLRY
ncbi:MAG: Vms1/Ankzf1 family peptidyl-tRNA hydrolase [Solirubrobacteraceae bacterium]